MSSPSRCPFDEIRCANTQIGSMCMFACVCVCVCSLSATFAVGNFPVARTKKVFQPQTGSSLSLSASLSPGHVPGPQCAQTLPE